MLPKINIKIFLMMKEIGMLYIPMQFFVKILTVKP